MGAGKFTLFHHRPTHYFRAVSVLCVRIAVDLRSAPSADMNMAGDVDAEIERTLVGAADSIRLAQSDERSPSVLIVSPVRLIRDALALVLQTRGLPRVVVASGPSALECLRDVDADIAIIDVSRPSMFPLMQQLAARYAHVRLLALGVGESETEVLACAEAGAAGYLALDMGTDELLRAIENARRDELVCSPRIAALLFRSHSARSTHGATGDSALTRRERQVLELIDRGLSNKEIAAHLHISLTTVKNHVHRILEKMQVRRRGAAAARLHASATEPLRP